LVRDAKAPHVDRETWTVKFPPKIVEDFDRIPDKVVKIVGVSDDLHLVQRCEADAQASIGEYATAARSQPYYLDVTHHDANKGFVADYLSRSLDIPQAEIATIGDQPNDVLMFRRSGFSIAMGNASDEVKRQASAVTQSYDEEGFAHAVERFILN
jgi:hydroxymethylpyrimidine pyrophosphatase-like HAD family hydrolase